MPSLRIHLPDDLQQVPFAGEPLMQRWVRLGETAGLTGGDGREVVLDGRFALIEPGTLQELAACADGTTLIGPGGKPIAIVGPAGQPLSPGSPVRAIAANDPQSQHAETIRAMLELSRTAMQRRIGRWIDQGVIFVDPSSSWIGPAVSLEAGVTVWGQTVLRGTTHVETGAEVQERCSLEDSRVCTGAILRPGTVAVKAHIGPNSRVGPMAHLREGTRLEGDNRVGNFVETKNAQLDAGAKASHLSYLGDVCVGAGSNVGAGTITCNYDGWGKHRTQIGANAFIGSNTCLVAPVSVGEGALIGAGSVICTDVPDHALGVTRSEQKNLPGAAPKLHKRNRERARKASLDKPHE